MLVINAVNPGHALEQGISILKTKGLEMESRNGSILEYPTPVTTVYENPIHRVLPCMTRDANPFFHLMESLWIIHGRQDIDFLTSFNKRMSDYSDDDIVFNAPYGHRLRYHFGYDQIRSIIKQLTMSPDSRQAVGQIWCPSDLTKDTKDKACNMSVVFRVREGKLDMTVYNRSNDMIWGAYGANVVQFSMLHEYIAASIHIPMGTYYQVSNSYHVYTHGLGGELWERLSRDYTYDHDFYSKAVRPDTIALMKDDFIIDINSDINEFFELFDKKGIVGIMATQDEDWNSAYFRKLVIPMLGIYYVHKTVSTEEARNYVHNIEPDDWRIAAYNWLTTRLENKSKSE